MLRRSLEIGESKLGLDHPDNLGRLNNLSLLLCETGRLKEAEPLLRRAVAVAERVLERIIPWLQFCLTVWGSYSRKATDGMRQSR